MVRLRTTAPTDSDEGACERLMLFNAETSFAEQKVRKALDAMPECERRILELRFGFEGEPWTLEAIGHELDLTRERVRQLEGQALSRIATIKF